MDNATSGLYGLLNENHSAIQSILLYELLFREFPEGSKTRQAIVIALGYPPEVHGRILLLKTPHLLTIEHIEHREISHKPINTLSNARELSKYLEDAMWTYGGKYTNDLMQR